MFDEPTPRNLQERTGKHYCIWCRVEISADEYLKNDFLCDQCAEEQQKKNEGGRMKDE